MNQSKRAIHILVCDPENLTPIEESVFIRLESLRPNPVRVDRSGGEKIDRSIDGGVLVIPAGSWPSGTLAFLTRFSDLPFLALLDEGSPIDLARSWYSLGAELVLDCGTSCAVLSAAVERLREIERRSVFSQLTKKELILFEILRRAGHGGVARKEMAERIWPDVQVHDKTLDVHVFNLRRKLNGTSYRIEVQNSTLRLVDMPKESDSSGNSGADLSR